MHKLFIPLLFTVLVIIMAQNVMAEPNLNYWNTTVSLGSDRDATFEVIMSYNETVTEHEYFVRTDVRDVNVYADEKRIQCNVERKNIGTTIRCDNFEAQTIRYNFITKDIISNLNNLKNFDYRFSVSRITDNFHITVKLPVGFTIVTQEKLDGTGLLPVEPDNGISSSDGRRIFISWNMAEPLLGDKLDVSIIYERTGFDLEQLLLIVFVLFLIFVMVAITITFRKRGVKDVLTVLHENERRIVQILMKEKSGVDQRRIVKDTGLSKSMISRLVKDLELRGIINVVKKGRTNRISLVDKRKAKNLAKQDTDKPNKEHDLPYTPENDTKTENNDDLE